MDGREFGGNAGAREKKIKENDGNGLALSKWFVAGKCKFVSGIDVFRKSARLRVYKVDEEKKREKKKAAFELCNEMG